MLSTGHSITYNTSRDREVGLTNRVIAGLLMHQWRTNDTNCSASKFSQIQTTCTGPNTVKSYGVDPVFKSGTNMYDPTKSDPNNMIVQSYYNCTLLPNPTYNVWDEATQKYVNPAPNMTDQYPQNFCAELYNPNNLPYAFHYLPLAGKEDGFPVFFDINLSQEDAQNWYQFISEGLYMDTHTRGVTAELVTYNAQLRMFGYYYVSFYFSDGGTVDVSYRLQTVRVELYNNYDDDVRFGLEIVLSGWICLLLLSTFWTMVVAQRKEGNFLRFFSSGWNWIEFISNSLLFTCMVLWWVYVDSYAKQFEIVLRYDVYADLNPEANYLALADNSGAGMQAMWASFSDLIDLIDMMNW